MLDLTQEEVLSLLLPDNDKKRETLAKFESDIKGESVTGAIIGPSGAGKSALINSICDLRGKNRAREGVCETTIVPTAYTSTKGYTIVDIPGAGTEKVSPIDYAQRFELFKYDFFIILLADPRLSSVKELNDWLIELANVELGKPSFLVRSAIDRFINDYYQELTQDDDFPVPYNKLKEETRNHVVSVSMTKIKSSYPTLKSRIYLIGRSIEHWPNMRHVYEFEELMFNVGNSLNTIKKEHFMLNFRAYAKNWIELKKSLLKKDILFYSITSTLAGATPVPGASTLVDTATALAFAAKCRSVFNLNEDDLNGYVSEEILNVFLPRIAGVAATVCTIFVAQNSVEEGLKMIPFFGMVAGAIVGGVVSGPMMCACLFKMRDAFADLLLELLEAEAHARL